MKARIIQSALKSDGPEKRLKSAVQFKVNEGLRQTARSTSRQSNQIYQSRLQSGTTAHTGFSTFQTNQSTARNQDDEVVQSKINTFFVDRGNGPIKSSIKLRVQSSLKQKNTQSQSSLERDEQRSVEEQSYLNGPMKMSQSQKLLKHQCVTQENVDSQEIKRRMRFDPVVRNQVYYIKIMNVRDEKLKNFLLSLTIKQKQFIDYSRTKQMSQLLDLIQDIIENAIGTTITKVLVEVLQFLAQAMECVNQTSFAIYFYNQVRLLTNHAKQGFDVYKMNAFIGLSDSCIVYEMYESAIKLLKKCLQYAWLDNDPDMENKVYSKLSKCYYYMGNISKATFYHERDIIYDYELESSPLRQLSCDTLKIFLGKYYNVNHADNIGIALLNRMTLPYQNDILVTSQEELMKVNDLITPVPMRKSSFISYRQDAIAEFPKKKVFSTMNLNGQRQLNEILENKEFDFLVYTPKHSFRSESKCFDHLNKKRVHPQDIYHDPKFKNNPMITSNLGIIRGINHVDPLEDCVKYKLPLQKQIDIRLKKSNFMDIESKLRMYQKEKMKFKAEIKNKILLTHKNVENEKRQQVKDEISKMQLLSKLYDNLIQALLQI